MLTQQIYENYKYEFSRHQELALRVGNTELAEALQSAEDLLSSAWKTQQELIEQNTQYRKATSEAEDGLLLEQRENTWLWAEKERLENRVEELVFKVNALLSGALTGVENEQRIHSLAG